jgi:hypothetical protein
MPYLNARDRNTFADIANIYALPSTEEFAGNLLAPLDLKKTVILCVRLSAIVSGIGNISTQRRRPEGRRYLSFRSTMPVTKTGETGFKWVCFAQCSYIVLASRFPSWLTPDVPH